MNTASQKPIRHGTNLEVTSMKLSGPGTANTALIGKALRLVTEVSEVKHVANLPGTVGSRAGLAI
jgi:hypothetical protein